MILNKAFVEDQEGVKARAESRRKRAEGVHEFSEPHELVFARGKALSST